MLADLHRSLLEKLDSVLWGRNSDDDNWFYQSLQAKNDVLERILKFCARTSLINGYYESSAGYQKDQNTRIDLTIDNPIAKRVLPFVQLVMEPLNSNPDRKCVRADRPPTLTALPSLPFIHALGPPGNGSEPPNGKTHLEDLLTQSGVGE